jgi:putative colanic acid biosysnthesis UDP-glucose lipid carrier transferase
MLRRGLLKEHAKLLSWFAKIADTVLFLMAGLLAFYLQFKNLQINLLYSVALLVSVFAVVPIFSFFGIYESLRARNLIKFFGTLYLAIASVMLLLAAAAFITKTGVYFSRAWFLLWGSSAAVLLTLFRIMLTYTLRSMRKRGWNQRLILIIGTGKVSTSLVKQVNDADWSGLQIVEVLDEKNLPDDLAVYVKKIRVDEVWVALPLQAENKLKTIIHELRHNVVTVRYFPDMFGADLLQYSTDEIFGFFTVNIVTSPMIGINRIIKWLEDKILAFLILLLISPIMLLVAVLVKATSPGPVFYKQLRHGWDGKPIWIYKFRSMYQHKEQGGKVTQAQKDDKRITPFGKILRATSLDELPQFINVLQGRMSIVGPRPHALAHNEHYKNQINSYMQRHHVKPGITGWAQINGWRGETDTLEKMEKRVEYDLYYIEHWSLWFDLKIIFLTIFKGFVNKNAY